MERKNRTLSFNGDLYPTAGADVVMTTSGDMVKYESGARARLGIGSANQILQVKSSLPSWETLSTAGSVLTTQGDILYENASGLARLGFGTSGDVLTTKGTGANPVWETPSASGANTALSNLSSVAVNATLDMNSQNLVGVNNLRYKAPIGITISSGILTKSQNWFWADTEGGAGTDDCTNIEGGLGAGDMAMCMGTASVSRDVTFVDGTLVMAGNFSITNQRETIAFFEVATNEWYETTRSDNASFGWKCPHYVAYFSDDNEEKIISEMERTYHNIVPAVVCDKSDSNKIDLKYFDNGNLITIPKSNYGINENTLYEKMRKISKKHLKKHIIRNSSKSVKQKEQEIEKFFI